MRWAFLLIVAACGGTQTPERGEAFCQSYEQNYMVACRHECETPLELGDTAGIETCKSECTRDLKVDDTFSDSCAERAAKL